MSEKVMVQISKYYVDSYIWLFDMQTLLQFEECEKKLLTFLGDEDTVAAKDLHSVLHLVQVEPI